MNINGGICLITFSNNADHQNVIYSMFRALENKAEVYTIGIQNPKSAAAAYTPHNYYFNCPLRPGLGKGAFRINVLMHMAKTIRQKKIKYLYFESLHLWNAFLMLLCPQCIKIEAIHDVIPHDGNTAIRPMKKSRKVKQSKHILSALTNLLVRWDLRSTALPM